MALLAGTVLGSSTVTLSFESAESSPKRAVAMGPALSVNTLLDVQNGFLLTDIAAGAFGNTRGFVVAPAQTRGLSSECQLQGSV